MYDIGTVLGSSCKDLGRLAGEKEFAEDCWDGGESNTQACDGAGSWREVLKRTWLDHVLLFPCGNS